MLALRRSFCLRDRALTGLIGAALGMTDVDRFSLDSTLTFRNSCGHSPFSAGLIFNFGEAAAGGNRFIKISPDQLGTRAPDREIFKYHVE